MQLFKIYKILILQKNSEQCTAGLHATLYVVDDGNNPGFAIKVLKRPYQNFISNNKLRTYIY